MKTFFSFIVCGIALALPAGAAEKKPSWKITGQLEESCSCNAACPCWFDSLPTRMNCGGNQVLFIKHGHYGKTPLDGLAIANVAQSPNGKTMMESFGKWNFSNLYIDEKASAEQRSALEAIGKTVLPMAGSPKTKVRVAPVTRKIVNGEHQVMIGNYGAFSGHLLTGGLGGTPKLMNPPGADPLHAEYAQGKASRITFRDAGQNWNYKGTNYMLGDFTLNSAQYEKFQAGLAQKMAAMKKPPKKS